VRRLAAWAVKCAVLRYGGVGLYRALIPAAIGIIAGESVAMVGFAFVCLGQSICFPNLSALISHSAPRERQGEMLGLNMSSNALARIGGPIVAGFLFSNVSPGAPFLLTAILILPALWFAAQVRRLVPRPA